MNDGTVFVGLDVHKDSITAACVGAVHEAPVMDFGAVGTQQYAIDRRPGVWVTRDGVK